MASLVTDDQLRSEIRHIVKNGNLEELSMKKIRLQLEEKFQVELKDRKDFLKTVIDQAVNEPEEAEPSEAEEEEDEEPEVGSKRRKAAPKASAKKSKTTKSSGRGGGLTKPMPISPELAEFVGAPEMARTQVVKCIFAYIKEHNLQNPKNRKQILCDEKLESLLKRKKTNFFQLQALISRHFISRQGEAVDRGEEDQEGSDEGEEEEESGSAEEGSDEETERKSKSKSKSKAKATSKKKKAAASSTGKKRNAFTRPKLLSDALQEVVGQKYLSRPQTVKRIWAYIKANKLQNPRDGRRIDCDEKLRDLFDCDTVMMTTMNKKLSKHLTDLEGDELEEAYEYVEKREQEANQENGSESAGEEGNDDGNDE
eukprot:TRINITY_DN0_c0_g2_i1.p1 TRINITY_DN0_c0_g2~~TRINITY_DN0_c0_g2_i1.p1  ORF type:complete len:369 (+),score=81.11 TRINITY_DN0_c0_g2_i1:79-1185(+)